MATDSNLKSVTNTLSTTTADTITLTQLWPKVRIRNHHATELLYCRQDGVTAVAAADGASVISPGTTEIFKAYPNAAFTSVVISIVGNGNVYTIEGHQP